MQILESQLWLIILEKNLFKKLNKKSLSVISWKIYVLVIIPCIESKCCCSLLA